jgi:rhamnogalacturonyl hydrolase YesR
VLPYLIAADGMSRRRTAAPRAGVSPQIAMALAIDWLCLSHDVTGRHGCSKGFSLLLGWQPPFPETTGYIIGTLLEYGRTAGRDDCVTRARELGEWELEVQNPDGGVILGLLTGREKPSTVFNTGMVMHGWLDLYEAEGDARYLEAAERAGGWLRERQDTDGAWRGQSEYFGVPHTYASRVSWALVRLAEATGDESYRRTAQRQLDWVLAMQRENGWFDACSFTPNIPPSTHVIAYTLRGLLESYALLGDERYLEAVLRTAGALIDAFEKDGRLQASFDEQWHAVYGHECLTGVAQIAGIWLRLYELLGDERFLTVGVTALDSVTARQSRSEWAPIRGALPGSYPIYGRYAPLQFPNWATKFLLDSLMLREQVLARRSGGALSPASASL